jgi:hypothetical protein
MAGNKKQKRVTRQRKQLQRMRRMIIARCRSIGPVNYTNRSQVKWLAELLRQ